MLSGIFTPNKIWHASSGDRTQIYGMSSGYANHYSIAPPILKNENKARSINTQLYVTALYNFPI